LLLLILYHGHGTVFPRKSRRRQRCQHLNLNSRDISFLSLYLIFSFLCTVTAVLCTIHFKFLIDLFIDRVIFCHGVNVWTVLLCRSWLSEREKWCNVVVRVEFVEVTLSASLSSVYFCRLCFWPQCIVISMLWFTVISMLSFRSTWASLLVLPWRWLMYKMKHHDCLVTCYCLIGFPYFHVF